MIAIKPLWRLAPIAALPLLALACTQDGAKVASANPDTPLLARPLGQVVAMRRLTEAQYRNTIADIFGPDILVAGRFEPIVRPAHQLIATGASSAALSPAGLEAFDGMARAIAQQVFDEAHRANFVPCAPRQDTGADDECTAATLRPIGRFVLRRPMTEAELAGYVRMARQAAEQSRSFYGGLQLALAAMLTTPDFLYVVESAEPDPTSPGDQRLDNYARASRLSFLLWNTTPSATLLDAAARGDLTDPAKLDAIAAHMVQSPRLADGVRAFFSDMLLFEKFDDLAKDPIVYPRYNPDVAKALPEQMLRTIVDTLLTRDADYRELFTTRRTFMNRPLGAIYNVPVQSRDGWEPHEFPAGDERQGLLSQAGFLALYSHSGRSSPTLRGRAIRELLLCQPVPNPPGNVNFAVVQDTTNKVLRTARSRLSAHATDPACSACHRIMDPIGLPLEKYDGIGVYRALENATPIDASGSFEGKKFDGPAGLGRTLATSDAATECVANRAYEYATGRATDDAGDTLTALQKDFTTSGYRIPALMLRIATMPGAYRIRSQPLGPVKVALSASQTNGKGVAR